MKSSESATYTHTNFESEQSMPKEKSITHKNSAAVLVSSPMNQSAIKQPSISDDSTLISRPLTSASEHLPEAASSSDAVKPKTKTAKKVSQKKGSQPSTNVQHSWLKEQKSSPSSMVKQKSSK